MDAHQPKVDQLADLGVDVDGLTFVVEGRGDPQVDQVVVVVEGAQLKEGHDGAVVVVAVPLLVLVNLTVQVAMDH